MERPDTSDVAEPLVERIRGLPVSGRSFGDTVRLLVAWAGERGATRYFACVNAHSAEVSHRDHAFMHALRSADLLVADGAGVVVASLILGGRIRERSTGPDLFLAVSQALDDLGCRSVFYLGGTPATLEKIRARHAERFPRLTIAGTYSPPFQATFTPSDVTGMADIINRAAPDVLWVGLGAPKQEKLVLELRDRVRVPLCGPVGAMFDYFAGNVPMPPVWVERVGLHWLYRLTKDPRRLWRRNLDSPLFLMRVLWDRLLGRGPGE